MAALADAAPHLPRREGSGGGKRVLFLSRPPPPSAGSVVAPGLGEGLQGEATFHPKMALFLPSGVQKRFSAFFSLTSSEK